MGFGRVVAAVLALGLVAACGQGEPELMNLRAGDGPDEFAILPPKPLQLPPDLAALPTPTPGAGNLTDPDPRGDAIAALGGNPAGGLAGDAALLNHTARYGRAADIRATLAAEDYAFRDRNRGRVLERLFNTTVYYRAYADMSLDQQAELRKWRRRGIPTPSAPPPQPGE
jgi:hypothetical protein